MEYILALYFFFGIINTVAAFHFTKHIPGYHAAFYFFAGVAWPLFTVIFLIQFCDILWRKYVNRA